MSYSSSLRGKLTVTRAGLKEYPEELVAVAKKHGVPLPEHPTGFSLETVRALSEDDGLNYLMKFESHAITANSGDYGMRDLEEQLDKLVTAAKNDNVVLNGKLVRSGEEQGDLERFSFKDNVITVDTAHLVWSDGTPVDMRDSQL
jgi:hypothetical protein